MADTMMMTMMTLMLTTMTDGAPSGSRETSGALGFPVGISFELPRSALGKVECPQEERFLDLSGESEEIHDLRHSCARYSEDSRGLGITPNFPGLEHSIE
ncbi:MAG: hypothetical protein V3V11_03300 [Vicinamibacteria bacterium]